MAVSGSVAAAQTVIAAGVTNSPANSLPRAFHVDSAITPLHTHVLRGAEAGGAAGGLLSVGVLVSLTRFDGGCRLTTPGAAGSCDSGVPPLRAAEAIVGSTLAGGLLGTFFGYMYHVNAEEQRAAKCRAAPSACK